MNFNLRKYLLITVITIVLILYVGCKEDGKQEVDTNITKTDTITTTSQNNEYPDDKVEVNEKTYQEFDDLKGTWYDLRSYANLAIDTPMRSFSSHMLGDDQIINGGDVFVFLDSYVEGTSDTEYEVDISKIENASQILKAMEKQFVSSAPSVLGLTVYTEQYEILKEEQLEINGWDMCRYKGYFVIDSDSIKDDKAQFVMYTILKEEYPFYFVVMDNSDEQDQWDYIFDVADKMAQTFREYKK